MKLQRAELLTQVSQQQADVLEVDGAVTVEVATARRAAKLAN